MWCHTNGEQRTDLRCVLELEPRLVDRLEGMGKKKFIDSGL